MKSTAIFFLVLTTLILITVTFFSVLNFSFAWVFYLTMMGQFFLVYTAYRVLKDNYTTEKTFEDFYEDHPIGREELYS